VLFEQPARARTRSMSAATMDRLAGIWLPGESVDLPKLSKRH
jgi:hypothetical protein